MANCVDCGKKLTGHGKPTRCRHCASVYRKANLATLTPESFAKRSVTMHNTCMEPEYNARLSELRKKDWAEGKFGGDEHRKKCSEAAKKRWASGKYDSSECRANMSEGLKKSWAQGKRDSAFLLDMVQTSPSKLELKVLNAVASTGAQCISGFKPNDCLWQYDICLPDYKVLIEVDGDYWHHSDWAASQGVPEKDEAKDNWAIEHGYTIIRLPENYLVSKGINHVICREIMPWIMSNMPNS